MRRKRIRTVLQILILIVLMCILASALYTFKSYIPYQEQEDVTFNGDKGFIALSYFGVARTGDQTLIAEDRLREHLQALKNNGYYTVTQQDIENYYKKGQELPERALYLMFEDGRRDTAIFTQKILEDMDYIGTVMTYPEKFELKDTKFLMPKDLQALEETTFWEFGTNGYRLAFINAYDRYDNYLGELSPLKHVKITPYMGRRYNHYLMDYLRDENYFPKESYNMMEDRISYDYEKLRDAYTKELGKVPQFHVLMHANTSAFGNNREVSAVNERWITDLFTANFNREGFSWNNRKSNIYDLTRMQPQSYWYTNHVLMRIYHDQHLPMKFVHGRESEREKWHVLSGEPEFKNEKIVLTTDPAAKSMIYLKSMPATKNLHLSVRLSGNKSGMQSIYMRTDERLANAIAIRVIGDTLLVRESGKELFRLDLREFDGVPKISIEEDKKAAEVAELETFIRYAPTKRHAEIYAQRLRDRNNQSARTVAEGGAEYKPQIGMHDMKDRNLEIYLKDNILRLNIDGKDVKKDIRVSSTSLGRVALEAAWTDESWSQRNLADDVYDGVFEKLMIYDYRPPAKKQYLINTKIKGYMIKIENPFVKSTEEPVLYSCKLEGLEGVLYKLNEYWENLLEFFVHKM